MFLEIHSAPCFTSCLLYHDFFAANVDSSGTVCRRLLRSFSRAVLYNDFLKWSIVANVAEKRVLLPTTTGFYPIRRQQYFPNRNSSWCPVVAKPLRACCMIMMCLTWTIDQDLHVSMYRIAYARQLHEREEGNQLVQVQGIFRNSMANVH